MRYIYDLRLSSGDLVPELGFGRLLRRDDEFELHGARWRVATVGSPTRGGVLQELLVELVDSGATAIAPADNDVP
jgi:hypothetical protein